MIENLNSIVLQPPFPAAAVLGLGALVLAVTFAAYWRAKAVAHGGRRIALAVLRAISVTGLVIVLMRPMKAEPVTNPGERPILTIAVDQSASMKTADVGGRTRDDAVREAIKKSRAVFEDDLGAHYDLRYFTFSHELQPVVLDELFANPAPSGSATDVSSALLQSANVPKNGSLAGIVLFSDGRDNAGGDVLRAATYLKGANAAVWSVPVGSTTESHDVYVTARLKQNYLFVDQPGAISVTVSQSGFLGQPVTLKLFREEREIGSEQALMTERGASVEFPIKESAKGVARYRVEANALPGEADTHNNMRSVFVRVVDERTRILFVESRPYWDSKFLLRALQKDPNVEVTSLFQVADDKVLAIAERATADPSVKTSGAQGVTLPRTKEDLFQFDCLIFGKGVDALLNAEQLALVRDFVRERGGGVVFSRGRSYGFDNEALAALEPLVWERDSVHGRRFELTPEGKSNPAFAFGNNLPADVVLRELPEMVSVTKVAQEKSLSVVLARSTSDGPGNELATIAYQRYGKGKVMSVGATGLWRWAIMPRELSAYDDVYDRFWSQMVRWLVSDSDFLPGQEVSFRADQYSYNLGDMVTLTARTKFIDNKAFSPEAVVKTPNGKEVRVTLEADPAAPGAFTARYLPEDEGEFSVALHNNTGAPANQDVDPARFTVYADSVESRFVSADTALLNEVSAITGGESIALDALNTLPDKLAKFEQKGRTDAKPVDAWDKLGIFAALIVLLAVEWFIRRRSGMV